MMQGRGIKSRRRDALGFNESVPRLLSCTSTTIESSRIIMTNRKIQYDFMSSTKLRPHPIRRCARNNDNSTQINQQANAE